jgi:hypothetical protein
MVLTDLLEIEEEPTEKDSPNQQLTLKVLAAFECARKIQGI